MMKPPPTESQVSSRKTSPSAASAVNRTVLGCRGGVETTSTPFAGLGDAQLGISVGTAPTPKPDDGNEDEFPEPTPSRANVLAALAIADDETDLDMANYYVQRAIAESLLLVFDRLTERDATPNSAQH